MIRHGRIKRGKGFAAALAASTSFYAANALGVNLYWDPDRNAANNSLDGSGLGGMPHGVPDSWGGQNWWDGTSTTSDQNWIDNADAIFVGAKSVVQGGGVT